MKNKHKFSFFFFFIFVFSLSCNQEKYTQGRLLYEKYCVNCHQEDGSALGELIPPLADSDYLREHEAEVACLIYYGTNQKMTVNGVEYQQVMPPNPNFNDIDIANLINYINNHFSNNNGYTSLKRVQKYLNECKK